MIATAERAPARMAPATFSPVEKRISGLDIGREDPNNVAYVVGTNLQAVSSDTRLRLENRYGALEANAC